MDTTTSRVTISVSANTAMDRAERQVVENPPMSRRFSFWNAANQYCDNASKSRKRHSE